MPAVHALTDVTGFGLAGHLLEICRGSSLAAEVDFAALPVIAEALDWVKQGVATGASTRNWAGYGHEVEFHGEDWKRKLLYRSANQRRTAGGLRSAQQAVVDGVFRQKGFAEARAIGRLVPGRPRLTD